MSCFSRHLPLLAILSLWSTATLSQTCPPEGDAKQALALELNPFKNRVVAPTADRVDPNVTLAAILAPGDDKTRWNRDSAATITGTVVDVSVGGIETCNCHATDPLDRDTHIEVAVNASDPETSRVIVEVTPRWRKMLAASGVDWSTDALKAALKGHTVTFSGWMLDDLEHVTEAENTNPGPPGNWRATIWEIHPVTSMIIDPGAPGMSPLNAVVPPTLVAKGVPPMLAMPAPWRATRSYIDCATPSRRHHARPVCRAYDRGDQ